MTDTASDPARAELSRILSRMFEIGIRLQAIAAEHDRLQAECTALAAEGMALQEKVQRLAQGAAAPPAGLQ
jgi:hypothetical protein